MCTGFSFCALWVTVSETWQALPRPTGHIARWLRNIWVFGHAAAGTPADESLVRMQGHELSPGSLRCLARASRLEALSVDGISIVGTEGWSALGQLTHLTSLAVRSRGDNTGLNHVRPPSSSIPVSHWKIIRKTCIHSL